MNDKASVPPDDTAGLPPAPEVIQMEVGLLQNFCEILYPPRRTRRPSSIRPGRSIGCSTRPAAAG